MNILIIDDDLNLANKIKLVFSKKIISNRIKILTNYNDFIRELNIIKSYDIIIVDICLWNKKTKNGIDIVKVIRSKTNFIPVIIMSWFDDISWLEKWFNSWASDYIIKPFRLDEFELRIFKWFQIYLYSDKSNNNNFIQYNWLEYRLDENSFFYNWDKIYLTKTSKYILSIFLWYSETVLSDTFLIEKLWGDIWFLVNRNLRIVILRLKASLSPYWLDTWIKNIRWEWYILKKDIKNI